MENEEQSFVEYQAASIRKNWRTFLVALVTSSAAYVAMFPDGFQPSLVNAARFVMVGGLGAFGIVAKDASVSGTAHRAPLVAGGKLGRHDFAVGVDGKCVICGGSEINDDVHRGRGVGGV